MSLYWKFNITQVILTLKLFLNNYYEGEIYNDVMTFIKWNDLFIKDNIKPMTPIDLDKSINYEEMIDDKRNRLLDSSRKRLSKGSPAKAELLFMDIIKHLEHIGDYSLNISQALEQID